jgi:hypothetical protein
VFWTNKNGAQYKKHEGTIEVSEHIFLHTASQSANQVRPTKDGFLDRDPAHAPVEAGWVGDSWATLRQLHLPEHGDLRQVETSTTWLQAELHSSG